MKRILMMLALSAFLVAALSVSALSAFAGQLPSNCTKDRGEVTCTTFEGPGKNQAGVGTTTEKETQGNTTNTSPEPQDLDTTSSCKPPSSQGKPCNP